MDDHQAVPDLRVDERTAATPSVEVVRLLRDALDDAVSTDPHDLEAARADKSGHASPAPPLAVVSARSVADVQRTLEIATAHRVPVVPRGAGTGLTGGSTASTGEVVLSTLAMNRILEIDAADELAVVEPGVINGDLNDALAPHGLWYAPDPASRAISTVGGNIATGAGGLLCAKYGVTREAVLGLDVVLADGTLLRLGHRTVKGVTGLDLVGLMIGSEGALGVVVGATVKVLPRVEGEVATIGAYFPDVTAAAAASASITVARQRPAAMELIDAPALERIGQYLGLGLAGRGQAYLLVQTDGADAAAVAARALELIEGHGGDARLTADPTEGERLLAVRRAFHPAMAAHGTVLIEDVAVPRSALPRMFAEIARIGERHGLVIPTVAHAGDGNLHPNFVFDGPGVPPHVWAAADELFETALALGGTLTGEHGIGLLKRHHLGRELGDAQLDLQRRIKAVFDPLGILNPGKVF